MAPGKPEPLCVTHHSISVEKHNEAVLAIQQVIDLLMNAPYVVAQDASERHGSQVHRRRWRRIRRMVIDSIAAPMLTSGL